METATPHGASKELQRENFEDRLFESRQYVAAVTRLFEQAVFDDRVQSIDVFFEQHPEIDKNRLPRKLIDRYAELLTLAQTEHRNQAGALEQLFEHHPKLAQCSDSSSLGTELFLLATGKAPDDAVQFATEGLFSIFTVSSNTDMKKLYASRRKVEKIYTGGIQAFFFPNLCLHNGQQYSIRGIVVPTQSPKGIQITRIIIRHELQHLKEVVFLNFYARTEPKKRPTAPLLKTMSPEHQARAHKALRLLKGEILARIRDGALHVVEIAHKSTPYFQRYLQPLTPELRQQVICEIEKISGEARAWATLCPSEEGSDILVEHLLEVPFDGIARQIMRVRNGYANKWQAVKQQAVERYGSLSDQFSLRGSNRPRRFFTAEFDVLAQEAARLEREIEEYLHSAKIPPATLASLDLRQGAAAPIIPQLERNRQILTLLDAQRYEKIFFGSGVSIQSSPVKEIGSVMYRKAPSTVSQLLKELAHKKIEDCPSALVEQPTVETMQAHMSDIVGSSTDFSVQSVTVSRLQSHTDGVSFEMLYIVLLPNTERPCYVEMICSGTIGERMLPAAE